MEEDLPDPESGAEQPAAAATGRGEAAASPAGGRAIDASPPVDSIEGWTVYAVDAHSLIFQVFHAMLGSDLSSPRGEPVGAVYGFTRDMLQLIERKRPTALIAAFDMSGPTFRHELYEAYKADRGEMPEELSSQLPKIREVLAALGIPVLESQGFEADDVLATLARMCDEQGARCLVVTGDKDCRQLITPLVSVYNIRKDEEYDADALLADWGIRPEQVCDFQALVGDKIDNVPGVPLIGPKLAKELLEKYGAVENVLDHAHEVSGKKRQENLIKHREDALVSRKLVELDRHVPIQPDWAAARVGAIDADRVAALFRDFGFRSLGDRALAIANAYETQNLSGGREAVQLSASQGVVADAANSGGLFGDSWNANYRVVVTTAALDELVATLQAQSLISLDTETTDVNPRFAEIVGYSFAWAPGQACYVPVRGPAGATVIDPAAAADALRSVLENPAIAKIGQNLKYDMVVLRSAGIELAGAAFDTMVASYLLDAGERSHNLDQLALKYLDHQTVKIEELIGKGKSQLRMDQAPVAAVGNYAAEDADVPLRLMPLLEERLAAEQLAELNETVETPLIEVLAELEHRGVCVDVTRLAALSATYTARLQALEEEIEELAGHPLNIASPKQLAELLFNELGLPVVKKTKTGASTDAGVLEELAPLHPLPAKIVEHRMYAKLLGTYIDALPKLVHPATGRVHSSLNQVVAATGRLSSNNPNLQNIPVRTEAGREIRSAFQAGEPGWLLLAADYSQIELRVLAHYTGDENLRNAFANDEDIHRLVAAQVNDVGMDEVTSDMRRAAKAVNFGIIYGQSPFGLAKSLGIEKDEAAAFIEAYFAKYPGVLEFFVETLHGCRRRGFVSTLLGRKRKIDGVREPTDDFREKSGALRQLNLPERTAVNTVIQGSAADLIKLAMLAVHRRLREDNSPAAMLLQIHDELLFETPPEHAEALGKMVVEEMTGVMSLSVPLAVDVKVGPNWAECE